MTWKIGRKILLVAGAIPCCVVLTLVSWRVASVFHLGTPRSFLVDEFLPPRVVPVWDPGRGLTAQLVIDASCWLVALFGLSWLVHRLRSRNHTIEPPEGR